MSKEPTTSSPRESALRKRGVIAIVAGLSGGVAGMMAGNYMNPLSVSNTLADPKKGKEANAILDEAALVGETMDRIDQPVSNVGYAAQFSGNKQEFIAEFIANMRRYTPDVRYAAAAVLLDKIVNTPVGEQVVINDNKQKLDPNNLKDIYMALVNDLLAERSMGQFVSLTGAQERER